MMRIAIFICILLFTTVACARRAVEPTRESRRAIDTMFTQQVLVQQPSMDTLCKTYGDSIFHVAKDSMLQERLAEMKELVQ
jgi:hypothetical protein